MGEMVNAKNIFFSLVPQVLPGAFRKTGHTFVSAQWFVQEMASAHCRLCFVPEMLPHETEQAFDGLEEESRLWPKVSKSRNFM